MRYSAAGDLANRADEFLCACFPGEETRCAGLHAFEKKVFVLERRKEKNFRCRDHAQHLTGGLDYAGTGHSGFDDNDVGMDVGSQVNDLPGTFGLPGNGEIGFALDEQRQSFPKESQRMDQQNLGFQESTPAMYFGEIRKKL